MIFLFKNLNMKYGISCFDRISVTESVSLIWELSMSLITILHHIPIPILVFMDYRWFQCFCRTDGYLVHYMLLGFWFHLFVLVHSFGYWTLVQLWSKKPHWTLLSSSFAWLGKEKHMLILHGGFGWQLDCFFSPYYLRWLFTNWCLTLLRDVWRDGSWKMVAREIQSCQPGSVLQTQWKLALKAHVREPYINDPVFMGEPALDAFEFAYEPFS